MPERERKNYSQTLLKGAQRQDKRQPAHTEIGDILIRASSKDRPTKQQPHHPPKQNKAFTLKIVQH